jgi:uncharacterized membrane protein YhiD involved in acid resistance
LSSNGLGFSPAAYFGWRHCTFLGEAKKAAAGTGAGVAIGAARGVAMDNIGLWLPIVVAVGAGLGTTFMAVVQARVTDKNEDEKE